MLAKALSWSAAGALGGMVLQLAVLAWLSRLLGATEFGLMASAALALRFVSYFVHFGLGPALIQRRELVPQHGVAALLMAGAIGLASAALVLLLAPLAGLFFRQPQLVTLLQGLTLALALGALASVPLALLRRAMRFKALAAVDLAAMGAGYGLVAVTLANMGWGAWSLVWGMVAQQGLSLLFSVLLARPRWAWPARQHFTDLAGYGGSYSLVGFLDFLACNVETLFIGRYLGADRLGVYNRAQAVSTMPIDQLMASVNRVMFPWMAQLKDTPDRLAHALLLAMQLSALMTVPVAVALYFTSAPLVQLVLGSGWPEAAPLVATLAWGIPAVYLSTFLGISFDSLALFRGKAAMIVLVIALKLGLMVLLQGHGLQAVVLALVWVEWLRVLIGVALLRPSLSLPGAALWGLLWRSGFAAGAVALGLGASHQIVSWPQLPAWLALLAQALLTTLIALPVMRLLLRPVLSQAEEQGLDCALLRRLAWLPPAHKAAAG